MNPKPPTFMFNTRQLLRERDRYKKTADRILAESNLVKILSQYGKVAFVGGYGLNLMMSGDIDIYVIGGLFNKKRMIKIFNDIVESTNFNSYFFGDWEGFQKIGFPKGFYIGAKTKLKGEKWKIDIWFLAEKQAQKFILRDAADKNKRLTILQLKKLCKENNQQISGYYIYKAVVENNIVSMEGLKEFLQ